MPDTLRRALAGLSLLVVTMVLAIAGIEARANEAAPLAADPALEVRVLRVAEELRCLVCQNETLAASQADLAIDLRRQIRTQLMQGQSEAQILDFMVQRYGAYVRYRPAFNPTTALLWVGPFVLLVLAAFVLVNNIRRRRLDAAPQAFDETDKRRLAELLGDGAARP